MKKEDKKALLKDKTPKQIADDELDKIKKIMDETKAIREDLEKKKAEVELPEAKEGEEEEVEAEEESEEETESEEEIEDKKKLMINPLSDTGLFRSELLIRLDMIVNALNKPEKKK